MLSWLKSDNSPIFPSAVVNDVIGYVINDVFDVVNDGLINGTIDNCKQLIAKYEHKIKTKIAEVWGEKE